MAVTGTRHLHSCNAWLGAIGTGVQVNAGAGSGIIDPRNHFFPPGAANQAYDVNHAVMMHFPVLRVVPEFVYAGPSGILRQAMLNAHFLTLSAEPGSDLTPVSGGVSYHNGVQGWTLQHAGAAGAKGCRFSFGGSFGAPLRMSMDYWGTTKAAADTFNTNVFTATPLVYAHCHVYWGTGTLTLRTCSAFDLTYDSRCYPSPTLPTGTLPQEGPNEIFPAKPIVTGTVTMPAHEVKPVTGDIMRFVVFINQGVGSEYLRFHINNLVIENPDDIGSEGAGDQVTITRQFRAEATVAGGAITVKPLAITEAASETS